MTILRATEKRNRYPTLMRYAGRPELPIIERLLADHRYLSRVPGGGHHPDRLAVTVLGTFEVSGKLGRHELEGLEATWSLLRRGVAEWGWAGQDVTLPDLHQAARVQVSFPVFSRWVTAVCSPRLFDPLEDPLGFCGRAEARGVLDPKTGFFERVFLHPWFGTSEFPRRQPKRRYLLSESGLEAIVDSKGPIRIIAGAQVIAELDDNRKTRLLVALLRCARESVPSLDLQAAASMLCMMEARNEYDETDIEERLAELGMAIDSEMLTTEQVARIGAVLRRLEVLDACVGRTGPLPKWAREPKKRKAEILTDLAKHLAKGSVPATMRVIKNATRVVRRDLDAVLDEPGLRPYKGDFSGAEFITYFPRT